MASTPRFSYQRLGNYENGFDDDGGDAIGRGKRGSRLRKVHIKRRFKVRVPRLKRFLKRKARVVLVSWDKVVKRLKESGSHLGDLFAGNYMILQVNPTPLKCDKSVKGFDNLHVHHGLSSRYSLPRVS